MSLCLLAVLLLMSAWGCSRAAPEQAADVPLDRELVAAAADSEASPAEFARRVALLTRQAEDHERRGYFEHAIATREELAALVAEHFGEESWQTRSARLTLEREKRLHEFDSVKRSTYETAAAEQRRAQQLWNSGDKSAALTAIDKAATLSAEVWGEDDYSVATLLDQQARWCLAVHNLDAAERIFRRVLAVREKVLTRDHPDSIASTSDLGLLLQVQLRRDEAESLLRDAAERSRALWGEKHLQYAVAENNLAMLLHDMNRDDEAVELLTRSLDIRRAVLGQTHHSVGDSLLNIGSVRYAQQKYGEAVPPLREALALLQSALGPGHRSSRLARTNLALTLLAQKEFAEAEQLLRADLEVTWKEVGERHPDYAEDLSRLAALYGNQGRYDEAQPLAERAATIHRSALGPDDARTRSAEELAAKVRAAAARKTADGAAPNHPAATAKSAERSAALPTGGSNPIR